MKKVEEQEYGCLHNTIACPIDHICHVMSNEIKVKHAKDTGWPHTSEQNNIKGLSQFVKLTCKLQSRLF